MVMEGGTEGKADTWLGLWASVVTSQGADVWNSMFKKSSRGWTSPFLGRNTDSCVREGFCIVWNLQCDNKHHSN